MRRQNLPRMPLRRAVGKETRDIYARQGATPAGTGLQGLTGGSTRQVRTGLNGIVSVERQSNDRTASVNYRLLCMAVVGLGLSGRRSLHAAGRATQPQNQLHPNTDAGRV